MSFLYFFDLLGTFAFAISGALLGVKKDMDIYGQSVLALCVAVGGGTIREIMLGSVPPFVLRDPNYLYVVLAAVACVSLFSSRVERSLDYINFVDAIGLGVFTVIGASKAMDIGLAWYAVVLCGILTSTGGGMIRDVFAREIPLVLSREVYASASMIGGFLFYLMATYTPYQNIAALATAVVVTGVRMVTLKSNVHLPKKLK
jgi:uncharacterized membrane protein YeiH